MATLSTWYDAVSRLCNIPAPYNKNIPKILWPLALLAGGAREPCGFAAMRKELQTGPDVSEAQSIDRERNLSFRARS